MTTCRPHEARTEPDPDPDPDHVPVPVPLCCHMNIWRNPQHAILLPTGDSNKYRNSFLNMQKQFNYTTGEQFEATVIMLDSILNGLSLFETASYFNKYGVSCPMSRPNSVLLREKNYKRLVRSAKFVQKV